MNLLRRLLTHRMRPVDVLVFDALIALAAAALCVAAALEAPGQGGPHEPVWLSVLMGALIGLPLAARHRWPVAVAVAVTLSSVVALLTRVVPDYTSAAPACALAVAFYALGLLAPGRRALAAAAGCLGALAVTLIVTANGLWSRTGAVLLATVMVVPAWLIGRMVHERQESATRFRTQLVREAAGAERLRVARELHDVIGHSMSLIAVKASVAVHVAEERPQEALDALRVIEATSRAALTETRQLLDMLRDDGAHPPTGVDDLRLLADRASAAGAQVRLEVQPDALDRVSPAMARSIHRIVQEALTNVVKHAAPAECQASVTVDDEAVRIEVVDDGGKTTSPARMARAVRPARPDGTGHGLIGMRERAGLHGGTFAAGPRPEGGFAVSVRMPRGGLA